jgi:hypothetical protein
VPPYHGPEQIAILEAEQLRGHLKAANGNVDNRKEIRHFATFRGYTDGTPDGFEGIIVFSRR